MKNNAPGSRRAILLATAALFGEWPAAVGAQPAAPAVVRASAGDLFLLAGKLAGSGKHRDAEAIFDELARDPNSDIRSEARFRHAKLLADKGMMSNAAVLLRKVLDEKPDATPVRLELAAMLAHLGDVDGASRELRAAQAAGLPPSVARLVDRYSQALRAGRPSGFSFEVALSPDSNINRATASDTLGTVFGPFKIGDGGKAKSGTGLAIRGQAYRRFPLQNGWQMLVRVGASADLYKQSDFNHVALDLGAGPEFRLGSNRVNLEVGLSQGWYGEQPFVRSVRLGGVVARPLGKRTQLRVRGSAALVDNQFNDLEDGKNYSGSLSLEHALSATTGVALTFQVNRNSLKDAAYSATGSRASLTGWREFGRLTVTATGEIGRLQADERLSLFPDKRKDRYSQMSLGATFRQLEVRGMAPIVRFTRERNSSSIAFYDYARNRVEVGVQRAF